MKTRRPLCRPKNNWQPKKPPREQAEAKAAAAEAELKRLQDEQDQALREGQHDQNAEFAEALVKEGRLKPADKDLVVQVLDFAEYPEHTSVDFGEGSTIGEALRQLLAQPAGSIAKRPLYQRDYSYGFLRTAGRFCRSG